MSSEPAIKIDKLSKCYEIYQQPHDRLKQSILPKMQRLLKLAPKKYYEEFWALKGMSLDIGKGETVGIIGRNGSGKSTFLQLVCGTLHPTEGMVQSQGRVAALLELGSGFNPEFTGRENVYLNAAVLGLTHEEIEARFADIVAFADIGDFIEQPVKTYSSGMYVRLAFAVIAHVDADILVIDEALAVGDAFFTQKCMRFLRRFMKTGTVLFVSHDTASVKNLCDRAIWLEKGEIRQQGSAKAVCENYLEEFYEAQQGASTTTRLKSKRVVKPAAVVKDQRQDFINASNLRNDIKLFEFDPEASSFGKGGARIVATELLDRQGNHLSWVVGGEEVTLKIEVAVNTPLAAPIIGFFIKDKLGQHLFGDNTYLSYLKTPVECDDGQQLTANFTFQMPRLTTGDYSVTVSIANGTQQEHVQHHWIHDALQFRSESTSVAGGLLGIPMTNIELKRGQADG
jgi:lipopolysaccharide transport system ATP-binding protein